MLRSGSGLQDVVQTLHLILNFNPILQGEKFDKRVYVKWVPELEKVH